MDAILKLPVEKQRSTCYLLQDETCTRKTGVFPIQKKKQRVMFLIVAKVENQFHASGPGREWYIIVRRINPMVMTPKNTSLVVIGAEIG